VAASKLSLQQQRPALPPAGKFQRAGTVGDQLAIPLRAVLRVEGEQRAVRPGAGGPAAELERQQCPQRLRFRLAREQLGQQAGQAARLGREITPGHRLAGSGQVALVEDQVDHVENGPQPVPHLRVAGAENDTVLFQYPFRPDDALRYRRGRQVEAAGDLLGGEPGHQPQRQGNLRIGGEQRMAAHRDQPQPVIGDLRCILALPLLAGQQRPDRFRPLLRPAGIADQVAGAVPADGHQPGAGPVRYPLQRPPVQRDQERLLH